MHHKTEVLLRSDGVRWTAILFNGEEAMADEMTDLDAIVRQSFSRIFRTTGGDAVTATFRFDLSVMPEWLRQYSDHYFNRIVEFNY